MGKPGVQRSEMDPTDDPTHRSQFIRKCCIVLVIVVVFAVAVLVYLDWLSLDGMRVPVTAADREMLVSISDLNLAADIRGSLSGSETTTKTWRFSGTVALDYRFRGRNPSRLLDLISKIRRCDSREEAIGEFRAATAALDGAVEAVMGVTIVNHPVPFTSGDECRHKKLRAQGNDVGDILVVRKGTIVYYLFINGVALDADELRGMLLDRISRESR
jgi:hypothetical protein